MRRIVHIVVIAASACMIAPGSGLGTGDMQQEFRLFLRNYEAKVIPLDRENSILSFNATISGKEEDYGKAARSQTELEKYYSDTSAFAKLKTFRASGKVTDSLLGRELDILYLAFLGNQIDQKTIEEWIQRRTEIERKFNTYRVKVADRVLSDNQVDSVLRYSTNSGELEATWKASKVIGREVAPLVIELAKLRNRAARTLGFPNFFIMQLKLGEQDPDELASLFDQLDSLTRGSFLQLKDQVDSVLAERYHIDKTQLRPWHYQNRFFQEAPSIYSVDLDGFYRDKDPVALARSYFAGIGLPVDSIIAHSDLYEKPGKYQHAECFDIDRSGDVRAVCNMRPDYYWMNTILHELGHGVYSYYNDRQAPWLLRDAAHSITTEAVANFFGRLASNPEWLSQVAGVPKAEVDRVAADCTRMLRLEQVVFSRFDQVMTRFERGLYENPDQDLNKLWWDLVEKYQGLKRPEGRNEPDWASKIHIATTPVYYHNYLIAELLASQFAETISRRVLRSSNSFNSGFANNTDIGRYFVDNVFHPGSRYPWNEMIQRATGEKLTSLYYARQFIGTDSAR